MLLVAALKDVKHQLRKAEDLREKIKKNSADLDIQSPVYGTEEKQRDVVSEWIQSHRDCLRNVAKLKMAIMHTNLNTPVEISVGEKKIMKPMAYWVCRRRDKLIELEIAAQVCLTDRGNPAESQFRGPSGDVITAKIRRYYDPAQRDAYIDMLKSEIAAIDVALEVANVRTELMEDGLDEWFGKEDR